MKKEQILLKVFRSRKAYLKAYILIILLAGAIIYFYYSGMRFNNFLIGSLLLIVLLIKYIEVHRISDWWAITDKALIESKSIFNKNIREIDLRSIYDIDLDQPIIKRVLGYGTITIRKLLNESSVIIKDINRPERFINILQDAIRKAEND